MPPKTLRDEKLGKISLRIVQRDNGSLAGRHQRPGQSGKIIDGEPGETQEELWQRLRSAALREDPKFLGYNGAIARFKVPSFPMDSMIPEILEAGTRLQDRAPGNS